MFLKDLQDFTRTTGLRDGHLPLTREASLIQHKSCSTLTGGLWFENGNRPAQEIVDIRKCQRARNTQMIQHALNFLIQYVFCEAFGEGDSASLGGLRVQLRQRIVRKDMRIALGGGQPPCDLLIFNHRDIRSGRGIAFAKAYKGQHAYDNANHSFDRNPWVLPQQVEELPDCPENRHGLRHEFLRR